MSHILVTHSHLDHSPLAAPLSQQTGAPVYAFGDSFAGRSAIMEELARAGSVGGGEGVDADFTPDEILADGAEVLGDGWSLTALHTPGHFGNHMSFVWGKIGFTGDHLMGWATSLVSPPDGDLTAFMASCKTLAATNITSAYCGHGGPIVDAQARIAELIAHRLDREAQIKAVLAEAPHSPASIAARLYTDVAPALLPMAERNVLAHLIDLSARGLARPEGPLAKDATFTTQAP